MSEPSGQTTNCSLIGEIWLVSMAIPRVQPGLVDHGGFVSPCPGTTFYVRKDYSQHQARFHWPWSSLRHHSHFTTTANFLYIHPIYHSITSSIYLSIHQIPVYFQAAFHLCWMCNSHMVSTWRMTCNQQ